MKMAGHEKSLIAWVLYLSVLLSSLMCAMGHGQMAGLRLSGLDAQFCSMDSNGAAKMSTDLSEPMLLPGADCAIASLFSAILLAAFFSMFGRLPCAAQKHPSKQILSRSPRHRWPLINPRASPDSMQVH